MFNKKKKKETDSHLYLTKQMPKSLPLEKQSSEEPATCYLTLTKAVRLLKAMLLKNPH